MSHQSAATAGDDKRTRGFTLIELLVVIALLVIVAGVAVPLASNGMSGLRVRAASREIAAAARLARDLAVASRIPHRLEFVMDEEGPDHYRVVRLDETGRRLFVPPSERDRMERLAELGADSSRDAEAVNGLEPRIELDRALGEDVHVLAVHSGEEDVDATAIRFDPRGHTSGGFVVVGDDRTAFRIVLARAAGAIQIERVDEWDREDWSD